MLTALPAFATIINVPDDYPTIQDGVDAASYWGEDTVLVQPGTYFEGVSLQKPHVTLASLFILTGEPAIISATVIDGWVRFGWACDSVIIIGFTVQNSPDYGVGGLEAGVAPTVISNIIRDNSSGGIYFENTQRPVIKQNVVFANGLESGWEGGITCNYFCYPVIENNLIFGNRTFRNGGGIRIDSYSGGEIINNTVFGNVAADSGGGFYCYYSSPTVINSIFWNDSAGVSGDEIFVASGSPEFSFCDIQWGWPGEGNIFFDPFFRDPANHDFHLKAIDCGYSENSPCIDAGEFGISDYILDCSWGLGTELCDIGAYGGNVMLPVDVSEDQLHPPGRIAFFQNYPNPFNPSTSISYALPEQSDVRIEIYNILGQKVATLFDGSQQAGYHTLTWHADTYPSGVYFARLETPRRCQNIKMVLLK